jgi:hypothetical protein
LEEAGVISLHGANIECDAQKELLLGVSSLVHIPDALMLSFHVETILFYNLHYCELARTRGTLI